MQLYAAARSERTTDPNNSVCPTPSPSPTHGLHVSNIPIEIRPRRAILEYQAQRTTADIKGLRSEIEGLERDLEVVRGGRVMAELEGEIQDWSHETDEQKLQREVREIMAGEKRYKECRAEKEKEWNKDKGMAGMLMRGAVWDRELDVMRDVWKRSNREGQEQTREVERRIRGDVEGEIEGESDDEGSVVSAASSEVADDDWEDVFVFDEASGSFGKTVVCVDEVDADVSSFDDEDEIAKYGSGKNGNADMAQERGSIEINDELEIMDECGEKSLERKIEAKEVSGEGLEILVDLPTLLDIEEDEGEE